MQKSIPLVKQYMTGQARTVRADESLAEVSDLMHRHAIRHVPVVSGEGTVVGILSHGNVQTALTHCIGKTLRAEDVMLPTPYVVSPDAELPGVVDHMISAKIGSAIVQDGEAGVVGIFTTIDALAFLREILFIQYGTDPERSESLSKGRFTGLGGTPMGDRWPFWT
ncbi:MAG: CBS domain-containing protein [Bdellovibrionales bacterium]|nr:CBS domain-containing protein [Bdellovibrionales bacterium]